MSRQQASRLLVLVLDRLLHGLEPFHDRIPFGVGHIWRLRAAVYLLNLSFLRHLRSTGVES